MKARHHKKDKWRWVTHPSKAIAAAFGIGSLGVLLFRPLPNGDGIAARAQAIVANPQNPLATDSVGNNIISIATIQMEQNAVPAIGFAIVGAIIAWAGRMAHF